MSNTFSTYIDELNAFRKKKISNKNFLIIAALVVGIVAGLAASLIKGLTHAIEEFLARDWHWPYKYYLYLFFPLIGILITVLYIKRFIVKGTFKTGLTPLLQSISKHSSKIEFHNIYSQIITAATTVGFGGSVGLEAPIVTSGAAIGSNIGRFFGLSYRETTLLLACGAAAGISGVFNSPFAGMVFAIEVLLPEFSIPVFIPLLLSTATAAVVAHVFYKEQLFYLVTEGWEQSALIYYVIFAIIIGFYSIFFAKIANFVKGNFYKIRNTYTKAIVAGILLGVLVFLFPALYGEGYVVVKTLLRGNYQSLLDNSLFSNYNHIPLVIIAFAFCTLLAKTFACLITVASGANGGVFAPSLILGGLLGFMFAFTVNTLGIAHLNVANFIVAGMAGALSGIIHAPLTGIFLIAEITGGYILMVPLMIVSAISYYINKTVMKHSMYTKPLAEKGELLSHEDKDSTILHMMKLRYLVERDYPILREDSVLKDEVGEIVKSKRNICPVLDADNHLIGLIYVEDIFKELAAQNLSNKTVKSLIQEPPCLAYIDEDLKHVLIDMEKYNVWILPVVNKNKDYIGFVSKTNIFNKYRSLLVRNDEYLTS